MASLGAVQQKIPCIFKTAILEEESNKRAHQPYRVVATDTVRSEALDHNIWKAWPSEKLDGTCVLIAEFQGRPWLWARLDRKPNKAADKRFKAFRSRYVEWEGKGDSTGEPSFDWDVIRDFKAKPDNWIPARGVPIVDGEPQPDNNGHILGWVPVAPKARQHCWHLTAVDLNQGLGLVLREDKEAEHLVIEGAALSDLEGQTAELIGTHVNANPYGIGSKHCPIHLLVVHGSIGIAEYPTLDLSAIRGWFEGSVSGKVEGIVWHCASGSLYKIHRHHLNHPWPIQEPWLTQRKVKICVDVTKYELNEDNKSPFVKFSPLMGHTCDSLLNLHTLLLSGEDQS